MGTRCSGKDRAVFQQDAALVEHAGIDVDRDAVAAATGSDGIEGGGQGTHMVPVAVGHCDILDLAQVNREVATVPDEGRTLGAGVEKITCSFSPRRDLSRSP